MATKSFSYNTEPHVAELGPHRLEFVPEADGAGFVAGANAMQERIGGADMTALSPEQAKDVVAALREFLAGLMLPESRAQFAEMPVPTRVLTELMEWVTELYGQRPTGPSSGSATQSGQGGKSGTARSRSKASTPATGP